MNRGLNGLRYLEGHIDGKEARCSIDLLIEPLLREVYADDFSEGQKMAKEYLRDDNSDLNVLGEENFPSRGKVIEKLGKASLDERLHFLVSPDSRKGLAELVIDVYHHNYHHNNSKYSGKMNCAKVASIGYKILESLDVDDVNIIAGIADTEQQNLNDWVKTDHFWLETQRGKFDNGRKSLADDGPLYENYFPFAICKNPEDLEFYEMNYGFTVDFGKLKP
jgi:hypothetical protein